MYIIKENNKKQTIKALSRPIYLLKKVPYNSGCEIIFRQ